MHKTVLAPKHCVNKYELVDLHGAKVQYRNSVEALNSRNVTACFSSFELNMTSRFISCNLRNDESEEDISHLITVLKYIVQRDMWSYNTGNTQFNSEYTYHC